MPQVPGKTVIVVYQDEQGGLGSNAQWLADNNNIAGLAGIAKSVGVRMPPVILCGKIKPHFYLSEIF